MWSKPDTQEHLAGRGGDIAGDDLLAGDKFAQAGITCTGCHAITHINSLKGNGAYTIEDNLMLRNQGGIEYLSKCKCWVGGFELGHTRSRGLRFNLIYRVLGLGDDFERRSRTSFGSGEIGQLDSL